jgi:penicillin-binding protein A
MKLPAIAALIIPASTLLLAGLASPRADDLAPATTAAAAVAAARGRPTRDAGVPLATIVPTAIEIPADHGAAARADPASLVRPPAASTSSPRLGEARLDPALGRYVAPFGGGRAILTLDPRLQTRLERTLASYAVPWGVTVLLEPATGRVLAMAEHSVAEPRRRDLAVTPLAPAASVFKIVTAAALLEQGVRPGQEVCYHGGKRRLQPKLLADDPRRDRRCMSLTEAMGHSANVIFAKLAGRGLDAPLLRATAQRFLFNSEIPFVRAVDPSPAVFPEDPFGLASTAAGFGAVKLSPLHGALLAAIVANGGTFVPPTLVDQADGVAWDGPPAPHRVVDEAVAGALAEMMRATVTEGTARRAFRRGSGALRGVSVAGKTGSLADPNPFRDYSWFVGYAPVDRPQVAVATVIVNGRLWRARAPTVAKEALEAYFADRIAMGAGGGMRTAKAPAP